MLKARLEVDLPGVEVQRAKGPIEWVRSLFGEEIDVRTGQVQTTVSAFSLFTGLYRAFARAGVTDAVSFLVDKRVIYVDTQEVTHDLDLVAQAAEQRGVLNRPFREMHLVLTRHRAGIHLLFDLRVTSRVLAGEPHLTVDVSGRPEELRIRRGETAREYQLRVDDLTRHDGGPDQWLEALDAITAELADAIRRDIPGAGVEQVGARVQLVRPGQRELARFRNLGFGDEVTEPAYRPVPSKAHQGAYADPFVHYWYDPYWDLTTWMVLGAMVHQHHWHTPSVVVVDSGGAPLFDGASIDPTALDTLGAASVGSEGVSVDPSVPDGDGWGGDDLAADARWGGSEIGDSWGGSDVESAVDAGDAGDAGGSGCGSSCGSSCGGGCGGGCS